MSALETYIVLNKEDITSQLLEDCKQTSLSTIRVAIDGSNDAILTYIGPEPASLQGIDHQKYTYEEIKQEINSSKWTSGEPY